jgi:hypothetical protein
MLKNARPDDALDGIRREREQSDEIKALATCWEQPDLDMETRERVGLIDATMLTPYENQVREAVTADHVRKTSFSQIGGEPVKMVKENGGECEPQCPVKTIKFGESSHVALVGDGDKVLKITREPNDPIPKKEWVENLTRTPYETIAVPTPNRAKYLHRINEVAGLLNEKPDHIQGMLSHAGIALEALDQDSVTFGSLVDIMRGITKDNVKILESVGILKGQALVRRFNEGSLEKAVSKTLKNVTGPSVSSESKVVKVLNLDIPQMDDYALVKRYHTNREPEVAWELDRRAKGQPFIVLAERGKRGEEGLDIEVTLQLLRNSRRKINQDIIEGSTEDIPVYKARDMDLTNRVIYLCPLCGDVLYKEWCDTCHKYVSAANRKVLPRPCRLPKMQAQEKMVAVLVQVNGKICGQYQTRPSMSPEYLEREALKCISPSIAGKQVKKVVVIPDKLVNLIVE